MRRITAWCLSAALLLGGLSGCGTARQSTAQTQAAVSWSDMQPTDSVDLEYAECFSVDHYDGGYSLITVKDDARYLVVPENASVPDGLDADIVVLQQPLDSIYLVSSSVMGSVRCTGCAGQYCTVRHQAGRLVHRRSQAGDGGRQDHLCGQVQRAGLRDHLLR